MHTSLSSKQPRTPWSRHARSLARLGGGLSALALAALASTGAQAAIGDTATWHFDTPATGSSSITGLFDLAATLTGTETAKGVNFVLTPNPLSTGISDWPTRTFVERLSIVYGGPTSGGLPLLQNANPAVNMSMKINDGTPPQLSMDAGYKTAYNVLGFDWGSHQFLGNETASWQLNGNGAGVHLSDFLYPVVGQANNKPSPIFGVISLTAYDLATGHKANPTPSNWVAMQVPEPGTGALLMAGMGVLGFVGRRRKI